MIDIDVNSVDFLEKSTYVGQKSTNASIKTCYTKFPIDSVNTELR